MGKVDGELLRGRNKHHYILFSERYALSPSARRALPAIVHIGLAATVYNLLGGSD